MDGASALASGKLKVRFVELELAGGDDNLRAAIAALGRVFAPAVVLEAVPGETLNIPPAALAPPVESRAGREPREPRLSPAAAAEGSGEAEEQLGRPLVVPGGRRSKARQAILAALAARPAGMRSQEVADRVGCTRSAANQLLCKLMAAGSVCLVSRGLYRVVSE